LASIQYRSPVVLWRHCQLGSIALMWRYSVAPRVKRLRNGGVIVGEGNSSAVDDTLANAMAKHQMNVVVDEASWPIKRDAAAWKNVKAFWYAEGWKEYRGKLSEHRWRQVRKAIKEFDTIMAITKESDEDLRRLNELMVKVWSIINRS